MAASCELSNTFLLAAYNSEIPLGSFADNCFSNLVN